MTGSVNHRPLAPPRSIPAQTVEVVSPGRVARGEAELESLAVGAVLYAEVRRTGDRYGGLIPVVAVRHPDGWLPAGAPYAVTSAAIAEVSPTWSVLRRPTRRAAWA